MIGILFVIMLVVLDQMVVGMVLLIIVVEFCGFDLYVWVVILYLFSFVIMVLIFGWFGDYYGCKLFVIVLIVVFIGVLVLCGMVNDMLIFVFVCGLQGIGGGMLVGIVFVCIFDLFFDFVVWLCWQVLMSFVFGIVNVVGLLFGGFLIQLFGWCLVFYVNLLIGILLLIFVWCYLLYLCYVEYDCKMWFDWLGVFLIVLLFGVL